MAAWHVAGVGAGEHVPVQQGRSAHAPRSRRNLVHCLSLHPILQNQTADQNTSCYTDQIRQFNRSNTVILQIKYSHSTDQIHVLMLIRSKSNSLMGSHGIKLAIFCPALFIVHPNRCACYPTPLALPLIPCPTPLVLLLMPYTAR